MQKQRKPIGEILKEAGLITDTHLKAALTGQKRWGGRIGEHLIKAAIISEQQLLDALSQQLGVAKINFKKSNIYLDALKLLPKDICTKYAVIPVAVKKEGTHRKLLLAMSDPTNFIAIQDVEFRTAHSVVTALATEESIHRAIDYCYHPTGLRESKGLLDPVVDRLEIHDTLLGADDEAIIITPEGELPVLNKRSDDVTLRILIQLLIDKGVFTKNEFQQRLEQAHRRP